MDYKNEKSKLNSGQSCISTKSQETGREIMQNKREERLSFLEQLPSQAQISAGANSSNQYDITLSSMVSCFTKETCPF